MGGYQDVRLVRPPLPKVVWALDGKRATSFKTRKRRTAFTTLSSGQWPVFEGNLEQNELYDDHDQRLHQQTSIEFCAGPVKDSIR